MSNYRTTFAVRTISALSAIAVTAAVTVAPAYAAGNEARAPVESAAVLVEGSAKAAGHKATRVKYCAKADITGTRIPKTVCKTKEEWAKQGVDVTAYQ